MLILLLVQIVLRNWLNSLQKNQSSCGRYFVVTPSNSVEIKYTYLFIFNFFQFCYTILKATFHLQLLQNIDHIPLLQDTSLSLPYIQEVVLPTPPRCYSPSPSPIISGLFSIAVESASFSISGFVCFFTFF